MAIRLRIVGDTPVALCAYETDEMPDDIYLNDSWHYALAAKFVRDWRVLNNTTVYQEEWDAMDTQKLRDAETREDIREPNSHER